MTALLTVATWGQTVGSRVYARALAKRCLIYGHGMLPLLPKLASDMAKAVTITIMGLINCREGRFAIFS